MKILVLKFFTLSLVAASAVGISLNSQAASLVAWGSGLGTNLPAGLTNVTAIAAGSGHGLALLAGGSVVGWGDNSYSQAIIPSGVSNVVAVGAGFYHSLTVKSDGSVAAWGYNFYGQSSPPTD